MDNDTQDENNQDFDPFAVGPKAARRPSSQSGNASPSAGLPPFVLPLIAGILGVVFVLAIAFFYMSQKTEKGQEEALPLIPAQTESVRKAPDEKEKTQEAAIYETFGSQGSAKEENLMKDEAESSEFEKDTAAMETKVKEEPASVSEKAQVPEKIENEPAQSALEMPKPPASKPKPPKVSVSTIQASDNSTTSIVSISSPDESEDASQEDTLSFVKSVLGEGEKPAKKESSSAIDAYYVQLGSVQNEARASQEWDRLQIEFPAEFAGVPNRIQRADLGARGVYYRIQAGPFSRDRAKEICSAIKVRRPSAGCLVVR